MNEGIVILPFSPYPEDLNGFNVVASNVTRELIGYNFNVLILNKSKNEYEQSISLEQAKTVEWRRLVSFVPNRIPGIKAKFTYYIPIDNFYRIHFRKKSYAKGLYRYLLSLFTYNRWDNIIFVGSEDAIWARYATNRNIIFMPLGVKGNLISLTELSQEREFDAMFLGNYEYIPNKEAALELINWFSDIALQSFRLILVGRNPSKDMLVKAKSNSNIRITGEVDNVYSIQNRAKVFVSPLRTGGGMKNKILQALSSGIKIIGTEESFSGLDKSLFNLVTCETQEEFIESISQNLRKDFKLDEDNINAVRKHHSWQSSVENAIFKSNP